MKPILLYQKEKEYLKPLPSNQILEQYMNLNVAVKVHNTSLINYKGIQYSVPKKYINKTLKAKELENKLYIYDNTNLVTIHDISNQTINYKEEHYIECLKGNITNKTDEEIETLAYLYIKEDKTIDKDNIEYSLLNIEETVKTIEKLFNELESEYENEQL